MRLALVPSLLCLASCATVHSAVQITGTPRAPVDHDVPVFFAVSPGFRYREIGAIQASGRNERAHLPDLVDEAEAQARALGADAIVVRGVRTTPRWVTVSVMPTCTSMGGRGMVYQYACPGVTTALEVTMDLDALAVQRDDRAPEPVDRRWPLPPPLDGPVPAWQQGSAHPTRPVWPDPDEPPTSPPPLP